MSLLKSIVTLASTPVQCLGEIFNSRKDIISFLGVKTR